MSAQAIANPPMAAKKKGPVGPKATSVKIHDDVLDMARIVALYEDVTITELLSGVLRPILKKKEEEGAARRAKMRGGDPK